MLELIKEYLRFGLESGADKSVWLLLITAVLVAAMILKRQSRD